METKTPLTITQCIIAAELLAEQIKAKYGRSDFVLFGIPRGGIPAVLILMQFLPGSAIAEKISHADLIVDDLFDSGATAFRLRSNVEPSSPFVALFGKQTDAMTAQIASGDLLVGEQRPADDWIVFPWEGSEVGSASDIVTRLLQFLGEDPHRQGLEQTPERCLEAWKQRVTAQPIDLTAESSRKTDLDSFTKILQPLEFMSTLREDLTPFYGEISVGYYNAIKEIDQHEVLGLLQKLSKTLSSAEEILEKLANAMFQQMRPDSLIAVIKVVYISPRMPKPVIGRPTEVLVVMKGSTPPAILMESMQHYAKS